MLFLLASLLCSAPPMVTVDGERFALGDLLQNAPQPWASLDLGTSPEPGQGTWIDAAFVRRRLTQAQLGRLPIPLPKRIHVVRSVQRLDEIALRDLVYSEIVQQVDPQSVRSLTVHGGVVLPRGDVFVSVHMPDRIHDGPQTLTATVQSEHGPSVQVPVSIMVRANALKAKPIIQRGNPVTVRLRQGGITIEAPAVAQEAGARGATIAVLPSNGTKMIHGKVVDSRLVEVVP